MAAAAPRATPMTIVSGAVAGDDLEQVAGSAAEAIAQPVAIALPALAEPAVSPPGAVDVQIVDEIVEHARSVARGDCVDAPPAIAEKVAVRIGANVVGIVAAVAGEGAGDPAAVQVGRTTALDARQPERRAWLDAAATAAAVTALMREAQNGDPEGSRRALVQALCAGPPADVAAFVEHARRLGFDLGSGAVALCARRLRSTGELPANHPALLAEVGEGRLVGLLPLAATDDPHRAATALADALTERGMEVAISAPRKDPAALHDALREAELLVELAASPEASVLGQEETYRLLIGVLLRERDELALLHARTISPLAAYDSRHDTDLLATLRTFLAHDGSTTDTADAMRLHRHTVGYRLSRVHEVSRLSPYESDGRERLSLGLKAHEILAAEERRAQHEYARACESCKQGGTTE